MNCELSKDASKSGIPGNPAISVAMASCNGAAFLEEQLESIYAQTLKPDELVVTDDCSTDGTCEILQRYSVSHGLKFHVNPARLGPLGNFAKAISLCSGDFIALSDQDDKWLPNKLEILCAELARLERLYGKETPLLAYSDLFVVDRDLKPLANSLWSQGGGNPRRNSLNRLLSRNVVCGCSSMMNASLRDLALPFPENAQMHDAWLGLVAAAFGRLSYLPQRLLLYRQHGDNAVGARSIQGRTPSPQRAFAKLSRYLKGKPDVVNPFLRSAIPSAQCLLSNFGEKLSSPQRRCLEDFISLKSERGLGAARKILKNSFFMSTWKENAELLLYFLFDKGDPPSEE